MGHKGRIKSGAPLLFMRNRLMSALAHKRTCAVQLGMSAVGNSGPLQAVRLSYVLSCWTAGATAHTLLGIVKDNAESMTHSTTKAAYAMPKVYSILTPRSLNWTVVNGEYYSVALSQWHNFGPALHARTLLGNNRRSSGEIASRFGQQNRNLERKHEISVKVL